MKLGPDSRSHQEKHMMQFDVNKNICKSNMKRSTIVTLSFIFQQTFM